MRPIESDSLAGGCAPSDGCSVFLGLRVSAARNLKDERDTRAFFNPGDLMETPYAIKDGESSCLPPRIFAPKLTTPPCAPNRPNDICAKYGFVPALIIIMVGNELGALGVLEHEQLYTQRVYRAYR